MSHLTEEASLKIQMTKLKEPARKKLDEPFLQYKDVGQEGLYNTRNRLKMTVNTSLDVGSLCILKHYKYMSQFQAILNITPYCFSSSSMTI